MAECIDTGLQTRFTFQLSSCGLGTTGLNVTADGQVVVRTDDIPCVLTQPIPDQFIAIVDALDLTVAYCDSTMTVQGQARLEFFPEGPFWFLLLDVTDSRLGMARVTTPSGFLISPPGATCPDSGVMRIDRAGTTTTVEFSADGMEMDVNDDGTVDASYPSCDAINVLGCVP